MHICVCARCEWQSADPNDDMKPLLEQLKSTHATSAGLKAFCTYAPHPDQATP
jgi:hypothetical protein